jgi:hypothetical protein
MADVAVPGFEVKKVTNRFARYLGEISGMVLVKYCNKCTG